MYLVRLYKNVVTCFLTRNRITTTTSIRIHPNLRSTDVARHDICSDSTWKGFCSPYLIGNISVNRFIKGKTFVINASRDLTGCREINSKFIQLL